MYKEILEISTNREEEIIDITDLIENIVKKSKVNKGLCHIFVPHATAGIAINECSDPNINEDLLRALSSIVPKRNNWLHDKIDNNAAAHIKSAIIGCNISVPIDNNSLDLGTWQGIMLLEFDGPRRRKIIVDIIEA